MGIGERVRYRAGVTDVPPPPRPLAPGWTPPPTFPAGPPFVAAPPPVRRRPWVAWLIVAGVVVLLCCGGGVIWGIHVFRGAITEVASVNSSAKSFFGGLVDGSDVYGQLCTDAKTAITKQQFEAQRAARPPQGYDITNTNVNNVNGRTSATVTVRLRFDAGEESHVVPMANEGGTWRVCGRPY